MADIFSRANQDFKGSFASDAAQVAFSGDGSGNVFGVGLLTQNLGVNYTQSITRLYEIGTNYTYLVAGRTQGQLSMGRVLGPRPVAAAFYTTYGNVCNAATNNLNFSAQAGCNSQSLGGSLTFGVQNAVIVSIGLSVGAQDMVINENLAMTFISLTLTTS